MVVPEHSFPAALQENNSTEIVVENDSVLAQSVCLPTSMDVSEIHRYKAEIDAAVTSLKTNAWLGTLIVFIFAGQFIFPVTITSLTITLIKGLTPIVTAIANFAKIQEIILDFYQENCFTIHM